MPQILAFTRQRRRSQKYRTLTSASSMMTIIMTPPIVAMRTQRILPVVLNPSQVFEYLATVTPVQESSHTIPLTMRVFIDIRLID
jgi:hypothetical protein